MISTREAYGQALAALGDKYQFHVFDADLSKATQTLVFAQKYPERFTDMGIAEANMICHAAGYAACGGMAVCSSLAMFTAGRAYEQIRNSIAYPHLNVKIAATHGGVLIGADGGSHQCVEDIALMRAIPGMVVLVPADEFETQLCLEAAFQYNGPVYLRFGRLPTPQIYEKKENCHFSLGKGTVLKDGQDVTLIGIGDMVSRCLQAQERLLQSGIHAAVIDMASVKPIDADLIEAYARKTGCIVTAEDHNVIGGLAEAVSGVLARRVWAPLEAVGIQDVFGRSGNTEDLAHYYHLTEEDICSAAQKAMDRKQAGRG